MLSQVLRWGLLGGPCTVQQFSLQQRQVGLKKKRRGLEGNFPGCGPYTTGLAQKTHKQDDTKQKFFFSVSLIFVCLSMNKVTSIILNFNYWMTWLLPQDVNPLKEETALSTFVA